MQITMYVSADGRATAFCPCCQAQVFSAADDVMSAMADHMNAFHRHPDAETRGTIFPEETAWLT